MFSSSAGELAMALVALVISLQFAGCETAPQRALRPTPLESHAPEASAPEIAKPVVIQSPLVVPAEPVLSATPLIQAAPPKPQAVEGWFDLAKWSEAHGFGRPMRARGAVPSWTLQLPTGSMEITAGSHFAHWNGMLIGLGQGSRLSKDGLQMHSLDLEKNIVPLATPFYFKSSEKIVMLDPGHGGANGGTQSPQTHQLEKNLTLDWALRIKRLLAGTGWTVVLTRTNDLDLTLAERVALTDEIQPDLFVSLHFNAMEASSKARDEAGVETYCLTPTGLPSNITREFEDDPAKVFANNQFDAENLQWAVRFHHEMLATTGAHDRGVRRARFMGVVREQRRPAVLIEGGYLSNPHEAKLLAEGAYREKLARAVAAAIARP